MSAVITGLKQLNGIFVAILMVAKCDCCFLIFRPNLENILAAVVLRYQSASVYLSVLMQVKRRCKKNKEKVIPVYTLDALERNGSYTPFPCPMFCLGFLRF